MTRPGALIRRIAVRLFSQATMDRLIDPVLADLQTEHEDAIRGGRLSRSRWIWLVGHVALIKALACHGGVQAARLRHQLSDDDWRLLTRTLASYGAVVLLLIVLLVAPFQTGASATHQNWALTVYLIPQALPIAIPVGFTVGILWGLGRAAASRRSRAVIALLALASSLASFTVLAWVMPAANQAFRVSVAGRYVQKGTAELTLGELLGRLVATDDAAAPLSFSTRESLARNLRMRLGLSCAPFVLGVCAVAVTSRRQRLSRVSASRNQRT